MRVVIADDEGLARERLRRLLLEMGEVEVVAEAANGREAVEACRACAAQLALLDIRMPQMDGLEAAQHLARLETPPAVVFTTAYGEHALEAFEAAAVDYLLKPVRRDRLAAALAKAARLGAPQLLRLRAHGEHKPRTHLSALVRGNIELLPVAEVIYFQADQKYVVAHHAGGELLLEETLKGLEEEFAGEFLRVHRNALVAAAAIVGLERCADGGASVRLRGTSARVEVSRRHLSELRRRLRNAALP